MQSDYLYRAFITNVIDGDTVDARVDLGFTVSVNVRFRLYGIDTPELRSSDEAVREQAKLAKQYVIDCLLNKEVLLKSYKTDKYGRWLADFFIEENVTISRRLVEEGLAKEYFGGKKE